jgi:hypothetical protein
MPSPSKSFASDSSSLTGVKASQSTGIDNSSGAKKSSFEIPSSSFS